ncbi:hypothetical protein C4D60_Mb03t07460 [Musa balbisiana]|uniref:IAA-alanine resistance protein 1 n=1 Tax=Musa balbisiana TaxID=52838 RepID=A0A4S8J996_MUSBA|nr:hypothetical protein C4D60_Mb03t07460 [Musa balbisiana]
MPPSSSRRLRLLFLVLSLIFLAAASVGHSSSCPFSPAVDLDDHHHHDHDHDHDHHCGHHHHHDRHGEIRGSKLPEELAEEEDLMTLDGLDHHHHNEHHHHHFHGDQHNELSPAGEDVWVRAMGCSLLVSMASLICLIILPGKPSKAVVDSLAVFGAGAMLGDAFLHQLPHAFDMSKERNHFCLNTFEARISDIFILECFSWLISSLTCSAVGIVLFFLVEKVVRYVEDNSRKGAYDIVHGHHHHHKHHHKSKDENENHEESNPKGNSQKERKLDKEPSDDDSNGTETNKNHTKHESLLRKRANTSGASIASVKDSNASNDSASQQSSDGETAPQSSLVFGYLNLFSDGVHNFTDGMALGSAFLLHGSVGGWSRTLFLLAHELPQEVGDFGILVRSGFSAPKALFFNFLSALAALAGTALALFLGKDPGQSSLIEGFTAGGFIYIAVAGVLPEMHDGKTTFGGTIVQLTSLILGVAVALCISLVE